MATQSSSEAFATATVNGKTVKTTSTTTSVSLSTTADSIAHVGINTNTDNIFKDIVLGIDVQSAYSNGTDAAKATLAFTFGNTESLSTSAELVDGAWIMFTDTLKEERKFKCRKFGAFGAGSFQITNSAGAAIGNTIQLISTDGTTRTYTGAGAEDTAANEFDASGNAIAQAVSLVACITATGGHGTKITAVSDGAATPVVTLTQNEGSTDGNTTITVVGGNLSKTNFTGGTGTPVIRSEGEFSAGTTATKTGDNFVEAVTDSTHGFASSITAVNTAGAVVVTQQTAGTAGNVKVYTNNWNVVCDVNPTTYFTGGAAAVRPELSVQFSHNGVDWAKGVVVDTNLGLDATGVKLFNYDFSAYSAPYARLVVNENVAPIGTSGTHQAFYSF
jgi:hypothetical protein